MGWEPMRRRGRRTRSMSDVLPKPCPGCQRLQAQVDVLTAQMQALQATVARLQEQLAAARKNSSTSSKPPSSNIIKPPKPAIDTPRSRGAQPGVPESGQADQDWQDHWQKQPGQHLPDAPDHGLREGASAL